MADIPSGKTLIDAISSMEMGMNCGLDYTLLKKNQASFTLNATVRGGLIMSRPAMTRQLTFAWQSPLVKTSVEQGLFQGCCYYSPDSGPQCLIASISGKIYQFSFTGNVVTVTDISISGDTNSPTTTQAWLWQAERFVIISDGLSLPIFYDGVSSRRSDGPTVVLCCAKISGTGVVTPAIGDTITLDLVECSDGTTATDYTGPYGKPILWHGAYYQAISNALAYHATLTTIYDIGGGHLSGAKVTTQPSVVGYSTIQRTATYATSTLPANSIGVSLTLTVPFSGAVGSLLSVTGDIDYGNGDTIIWRVISKSGNTVSLRNNAILYSPTGTIGYRYPVATTVRVSGTSAPNTVVATLSEPLASSAPGTVTTVQIQAPYTGVDNAIVFIDGAQYYIKAAATTPGTSTPNQVVLQNISDAEGTALPDTSIWPLQTVPELPACRMGCYGMGQNWVSLVDGYSFICSDISRGPSGTSAYDYRDAVLKTTEITFNGGSFAIPSSGSPITAMVFTAKMDESLGQGPLQICTATAMFSVNAPYDFSNPPDLNTPILPEVLKGLGPLAQNSTCLVNSDTFFRTVDGLGSFIQARRDFTTWGNTGISDEVNQRILDNDNQALLPFGSSIVFDNRFISTAAPASSANGVIHRGAVVINLDPVSNLQGKQSAVYDGLWTGTNTLQYVGGLFSGVSRAFAFGYNTDLLKTELYELLPQKSDVSFDNGNVPIKWGFETAGLFNSDTKPNTQLIRLIDGEIAVDQVLGPVHFKIWYRFDSNCWNEWADFSICGNPSGDPQCYPRLGLGKPSQNACDEVNQKTAYEGYVLQVKFEITGHCRFLRGRFKSVTADAPEFAPPLCDNTPECITLNCPEIPDLDAYSLQSNILFNTNPLGVVVDCPVGAVCIPGVYPTTIVYPPGTFVFPDTDNNFYGVNCSGESVIGTSMDNLIEQLAEAQALCDVVVTPPPSGGSAVELSLLSGHTSCVDASFSETITATATGTVTFTLLDGALPTGLSMSADGNTLTISGTASEAGEFYFVIKAALSESVYSAKAYIIQVAEVDAGPPDSGTVGDAYSYQLAVDGPSTGSETWSISEGSLPDGLTLDPATGIISGTPTTEGTSTFTVCFTNDL